MTTEKLEQKTEKITENSYTNKNFPLKTFNQVFDESQTKNYSDTKRELALYSKNNSFKNYNCFFYSLFI